MGRSGGRERMMGGMSVPWGRGKENNVGNARVFGGDCEVIGGHLGVREVARWLSWSKSLWVFVEVS